VGTQMVVGGSPLLSPGVKAGVVGALLLTTVAGPVGLAQVLRKSK